MGRRKEVAVDLWTVFVVLGIVVFILIIAGRR